MTLRADRTPATLLLALDTGATYSMLTDRTWRMLGFHSSGLGDPISVAAVGGVAAGRWAELSELYALGRRLVGFRVVVVPVAPAARIHGLLGLDFLRGSRLTIDFRRGEIDLET